MSSGLLSLFLSLEFCMLSSEAEMDFGGISLVQRETLPKIL
jgi:hypothetical protein